MTDTSEYDSSAPYETNSNYSMASTITLTETATNQSNRHDQNMEIFCKQMLKTRVFLGHYQEKRYVDGVKDYRDVIVISKRETDIIGDLEIVRQRVLSRYGRSQHLVWMGYTNSDMVGAPVGSCLWTELPVGIPFGQYWFQIKTVRFRAAEVLIKVKMLRPMFQSDQQTEPNIRTTQTSQGSSSQEDAGHTNNDGLSAEKFVKDISQICLVWRASIHNYFVHEVAPQITATNMISFMKFLLLMTTAALTASVHSIQFLGMFTLRFMEESSRLIHVLMPFLLQCLDLFGKLIGGLYLLIAMIWRDSIGGGGGRGAPRHRPEALMPDERGPLPPPQQYGTFANRMGEERRGNFSGSYMPRYRR